VTELLGIRILDDRVELPDPPRSIPIQLAPARPRREAANLHSHKAKASREQRRKCVDLWLHLYMSDPQRTFMQAAELLSDRIGKKISLRTLQLWSKQLTEPEPVSTFRRLDVSEFTVDQKREALLIAAWWCHRINNVKIIDNKMLRAALTLLDQGYSVADVLATIDAYYAYDTDRAMFPFKPFVRWAKYDFPKWLLRAADAADFRRALSAAKLERREENRPVCASALEQCPSPRERKRDAIEAASKLARMGLETAARQVAVSAIPQRLSNCGNSIIPLAANNAPSTMAEGLGRLDDRMRGMLLRAAGADHDKEAKEARVQAAATIVLWWDAMPETVRHNIDFAVNQWQADHPKVDAQAAGKRRVQMLIPHLRKREGFTTLGVVSRMPVR